MANKGKSVFRDMLRDGPHRVRFDGVDLVFEGDGVLTDPTEEQLLVMKASALRVARFVEVELVGKSPAASTPFAGESFVNEVKKDAGGGTGE